MKKPFNINKLAKQYNGGSHTCVHLYFAKHFSELTYFFSKSKGCTINELRVSFTKVHHTSRWFLSNLPPNLSSRIRRYCGRGVFKNFAKFTGKHLFQSLFVRLQASSLLLMIVIDNLIWWICIIPFKSDL